MFNRDPRNRSERLQSSFALLLFGLGVLAFLAAIDRPHWFHLRPATGTAAAMAKASAGPARIANNPPDRAGALR